MGNSRVPGASSESPVFSGPWKMNRGPVGGARLWGPVVYPLLHAGERGGRIHDRPWGFTYWRGDVIATVPIPQAINTTTATATSTASAATTPVNILCLQFIVTFHDGVVGHHRITGRQDASRHMAHAVQHAVIHQEVVHQQLFTQRGGPVAALVKNKEIAHLTADGEAYPKLLHSPLWRLGVVPQFDHRHLHRPIEDDVHAVHLRGNNRYAHRRDGALSSGSGS
ncbi:hypothetical protein EYF80_039942 [Liparis tanakae]|uniref:Uncharacterized protein n=1 Tax=Liparis tanakae TaxID=230148 RepID=A0A4Z2G8J1_9TELE|nr:hypothetical protein EYF80_039942 [Liparis tanakae]